MVKTIVKITSTANMKPPENRSICLIQLIGANINIVININTKGSTSISVATLVTEINVLTVNANADSVN